MNLEELQIYNVNFALEQLQNNQHNTKLDLKMWKMKVAM